MSDEPRPSFIIGGHCVVPHDSSYIALIDEQPVKFSAKQYTVLLPLLPGKPVTNLALDKALALAGGTSFKQGASAKYIEHLRKKLQPFGLAIRRVLGYGYFIHSTEQDPTPSP